MQYKQDILLALHCRSEEMQSLIHILCTAAFWYSFELLHT